MYWADFYFWIIYWSELEIYQSELINVWNQILWKFIYWIVCKKGFLIGYLNFWQKMVTEGIELSTVALITQLFQHFMSQNNQRTTESNVYRVWKNSGLNQGFFLCELIMKKHVLNKSKVWVKSSPILLCLGNSSLKKDSLFSRASRAKN